MNYLRKELKQFEPYTPGEQPSSTKKIIKLNTNENPFPPSKKIETYLKSGLPKLGLEKYPNPESQFLKIAIASKWDLDKDQILVTNGSDEAIRLLFLATLPRNGKLIIPFPTYSYYPVMANQLFQNNRILSIPLNDDFSIPLEKIFTQKGNLLALANPNAPTGILEKKEELIFWIKKFPGLVLIDEAYIDFSPRNSSLIDEIKNLKNLIITRTFSKSYSLAGARVGVLLGNKKLISQIAKLTDSYNVNRLSQEIAKLALLDDKYFRSNLSKIISERKILESSLQKLGFSMTSSEANFIFVKPPKNNAAQLVGHLKNQNIFVRYFSYKPCDEYLRISIGRKEENFQLLKTIRNWKEL